MLVQGYFKGQRSSINQKIVTFCELAQSNELIEWPLSDAPTSIHVFFFFFFFFTSFTLSDYCCLHTRN